MKKQLVLALGLLVLLVSGCGEWSTRPIDPPETLHRQHTPMILSSGRVLFAAEAKKYLDRRAAHFLDVRHALAYRDGRIPGAASVPFDGPPGYTRDFNPSRSSVALARLRVDKGTPVVIYGADSTDWRAYYAAQILIDRGYNYVMWMRGGLDEWVKQGYSVER